MDERLSNIIAAQTPSGAFPAIAHLPGGAVCDENAFVTALVIDLLYKNRSCPEISAACHRGIAFLLTCESAAHPGIFSFYPTHAQPHWIQEVLPPDADDTALCSLALYHAGCWSRSRLVQQVGHVLDRYRLKRRPPGAAWFREGIYPTWLDHRRRYNPIDLCVNINVAVLIAESKVGSAHYQGILDMVEAAFDWIGDYPDRWKIVTPYYSHPAELGFALQRAVSAGIKGAENLLARFYAMTGSQVDEDPTVPVCCSLGEGINWTSPVLQTARAWAEKNDFCGVKMNRR